MTTTFNFENQLYTVDIGNQSPGGLYRQNAMTIYQGVNDWAIVALDGMIPPTDIVNGMNPSTELFYLIKCKKSTENFYRWVQVDTTLGRNLVGPFLDDD